MADLVVNSVSDKVVVSKQPQIKEKLTRIEKELSTLKENTSQKWKTNGKFKFNPHNSWEERIRQETRIPHLLQIVSYINAKQQGYEKAAKEMELTSYPNLEFEGYSAQDWKADIKQQINIIQYSERKKKLENAKRQLEQFVSEEQKLQNVLDKIDEDLF